MRSGAEGRLCSNCRAELPAGTDACPTCGVFAGDLFDGVMPEQRKARRRIGRLLALLAVLALAGALGWQMRGHPDVSRLYRFVGTKVGLVKSVPAAVDTSPIRVVNNRPGGLRRGAGASVSEPEAVGLLRRHLASNSGAEPLRDECLAVMSNGFRDGAYTFTAVNRCGDTRLGRWRVDGKTGVAGRLR